MFCLNYFVEKTHKPSIMLPFISITREADRSSQNQLLGLKCKTNITKRNSKFYEGNVKMISRNVEALLLFIIKYHQ